LSNQKRIILDVDEIVTGIFPSLLGRRRVHNIKHLEETLHLLVVKNLLKILIL